MKNLLIATFLLFTFGSQAQSWAAKQENAQYQNRVNNLEVYTSEVKIAQAGETFSKGDFDLIQNRCLTPP